MGIQEILAAVAAIMIFIMMYKLHKTMKKHDEEFLKSLDK